MLHSLKNRHSGYYPGAAAIPVVTMCVRQLLILVDDAVRLHQSTGLPLQLTVFFVSNPGKSVPLACSAQPKSKDKIFILANIVFQ